jgi:hypothetical protein
MDDVDEDEKERVWFFSNFDNFRSAHNAKSVAMVFLLWEKFVIFCFLLFVKRHV